MNLIWDMAMNPNRWISPPKRQWLPWQRLNSLLKVLLVIFGKPETKKEKALYKAEISSEISSDLPEKILVVGAKSVIQA